MRRRERSWRRGRGGEEEMNEDRKRRERRGWEIGRGGRGEGEC